MKKVYVMEILRGVSSEELDIYCQLTQKDGGTMIKSGEKVFITNSEHLALEAVHAILATSCW